MKKILIGVLALTLCLNWEVYEKKQNTVIIYSSAEQFRGDELQEQLEEAFPDIDARVMYVSTSKSAAKLSVEKEMSDCDIFVDLETSYISKIEDSLADVSGTSKLNFLDGLGIEDHQGKYVTFSKQAGAIIVNKEILEKNNLPVPTTYDDLLNPIYKGLIAMPDPKSSGTGYFFYKSIVNERGLDGALEYFKALEPNIKQFTESGSGPIKLLIQGEIAIGLGLTFQAVNEMNEGSPFEIIFPPEGSPYSLTGAGVMKGRENDEDVMRVFSYIVNEFLQYDKENFSPEKIYEEQENKVENYPKDIKYADMTGIEDMEEKERLLNEWPF